MGFRFPAIREVVELFTDPKDREDLAVRIFRAVNLGDNLIHNLQKRANAFGRDAAEFAVLSQIAEINAETASKELELVEKLQDSLVEAVE